MGRAEGRERGEVHNYCLIFKLLLDVKLYFKDIRI